MPGSFEAAVIFVLIIAPGFLLQRGFQRGGTYAVPSLNLYAVAQAVVLSGVVLLLSAPVGGFCIAKWVDDGTLVTDHRWAAWTYFVGLLIVPFLVGLVAGRVAQTLFSPMGGQFPASVKGNQAVRALLWLRERVYGSAFADWLGWAGFMAAPTVWDRVWLEVVGERESPLVVEVHVGEDEPIVGAFASESFATTSPQPHGLFLETEYGAEGDRLVEYENSKGVFVDGSQIQSLRFFEHNPLEDQLWEEGADSGSGNTGESGGEPPAR
jgi:hypothetical protein